MRSSWTKRLAIFVVLLGLCFCLTDQSRAANVALGKPTIGDEALGFPTSNGVDGSTATFTHADNTDPAPDNPFWQVDLEGVFDLNSIEIVDRIGCCDPNRLNGSIVTVLDAAMSPIFTSAPIAGLPPSNPDTTPVVFDNGGAGFTGVSHIRVDGFTQFFQFSELRALDDSPPPDFGNLAMMFGTASQSTFGFNLPAPLAIDGDRVGNSISHTATGDLMPFLEVDLNDTYKLEQIDIFTRDNCCTPASPERDYNLTVQVLDENGDILWANPVLNPWDGMDPAGGAPDLGNGFSFMIDLSGEPGGGVVGNKVRISKEAFGGASHSEWLHIAEFEVFGSTTPVDPVMTLEGDVNLDEVVDINDYQIIRANFLTGSTRGEGDLDFSGVVDIRDFQIWKNIAFPLGGAAASVPEPTTCVLLAGGMLLIGCRTRSRWSRG